MIRRFRQILASILLRFRTISNLKRQQVFHLIWYRLFRMPRWVSLKSPEVAERIHFLQTPPDAHRKNPIRHEDLVLLNITASNFLIDPDWELDRYGKLWTYNLSYFEFLEHCDWNQGHRLMVDFSLKYNTLKVAHEPYPCALRVLNWVKFLSRHKEEDYEKIVEEVIWQDTLRILKGLELHLAANHVLENAFGLLFSAFFFQHKKLLEIAGGLLKKELEEQFQKDGGHYEQSLMYHSILLERMLDALNLIQSNKGIETSLFQPLRDTTVDALSFLNVFAAVEELPLFNDAADGVARVPAWLNAYGELLGLSFTPGNLGSSGFRKLKSGQAVAFVDAGQIGPAFQPGHAHADSLTFCLFLKEKPVIVDTGTSTYDIGARRSYERSTQAHNTVVVDGQNSSEVWGGFRVGRQAKTEILVDEANHLKITHNGYRHLGIRHQREFRTSQNQLWVEDSIIGARHVTAESYLHFHSSVDVELKEDRLILNQGQATIHCEGFEVLSLVSAEYARVFNALETSLKLRATFTGSSRFTFLFEEN